MSLPNIDPCHIREFLRNGFGWCCKLCKGSKNRRSYALLEVVWDGGEEITVTGRFPNNQDLDIERSSETDWKSVGDLIRVIQSYRDKGYRPLTPYHSTATNTSTLIAKLLKQGVRPHDVDRPLDVSLLSLKGPWAQITHIAYQGGGVFRAYDKDERKVMDLPRSGADELVRHGIPVQYEVSVF